jgi:hypothetical protein
MLGHIDELCRVVFYLVSTGKVPGHVRPEFLYFLSALVSEQFGDVIPTLVGC